MRKHNIGAQLTKVIEELYAKSTNAVLSQNDSYKWFETSVGVRQGCILSPCLFNIFLEQIMTDALEGFQGTVRIGGRNVTNLRFADDIDLVAGSEQELCDLTSRLERSAQRFGMEISGEKSKVMVTSPLTHDQGAVGESIKVGGDELERVTSFQYLGSIINKDINSENEIKKRIAIATTQLAKMNNIWKTTNIKMITKLKLLKALITSICLYGCESWTLNKKIEKRLAAFEMRCYRRLLGISWKQRIRNDTVDQRITAIIGKHESLVETVRRRKLQWFGHVTRRPGTLANTIMHGSVEGSRGRGRPKRMWTDDIKDWTGMRLIECIREAGKRDVWKRRIAKSKCPNGHRKAMGS